MTKKQWMWIVLGLAIAGGIIAALLVFLPSSKDQTYDESFNVEVGDTQYYVLTAENSMVKGFVINKGRVELAFTVQDPFGSNLFSEIVEAHEQYDFSFRTLEDKADYVFVFEVFRDETLVDIHLQLE